MAYGDDAGVQAINKAVTYTSTSKVSTGDLATYRNWIESDMDARISTAGYSMPITAPRALGVLSQISNLGVAATAEKVLFSGTVAPGESTRGSLLQKEYEALCARYFGTQDDPPDTRLPGAELADDAQIFPPSSALWSYTKEKMDPDELTMGDPDYLPIFDIEKQW